MRRWVPLALALVATGCATKPRLMGDPAAPVTALAETAPVGTANADAADDPAIWRNPADPAQSLIVATDKKAGLHVYGLDGRLRSFDPAGRVNNVDLIDLGPRGVLVVASDRNNPLEAVLRLYRLDPATARLVPLGQVSGGSGEAYGVCLTPAPDGRIDAFSVRKSGAITQVRLSIDGGVTGQIVRTLAVPTQAEGCVVDARTATLYVAEEDVGIWRFAAAAEGATEGTLVARADGRLLVADVEGLALAPVGADGGWLVASSQGDNAFAVYRLPDMAPAGRVRVVKGRYGAVEETDGIDLVSADMGPGLAGGVLVVQDGRNRPRAQNFKLIAWADVLKALAKDQRP